MIPHPALADLTLPEAVDKLTTLRNIAVQLAERAVANRRAADVLRRQAPIAKDPDLLTKKADLLIRLAKEDDGMARQIFGVVDGRVPRQRCCDRSEGWQ